MCVILLTIGELPSIEVKSIPTFTNNVWRNLIPAALLLWYFPDTFKVFANPIGLKNSNRRIEIYVFIILHEAVYLSKCFRGICFTFSVNCYSCNFSTLKTGLLMCFFLGDL